MAVNAVERPGLLHTSWLRLLAPSTERLEFALRLALICSITTLVMEIYQNPEPALAAYVVFFFNRPERTVSLILSVAFPLIIAATLTLILLVSNLVLDDPMWRVISIAVISFTLLFLASASVLRPVAGTIAMIVGYVLDQFGRIQTGELATRALLYTWLFIAIPAGVSLVVNLLLAPAPRRIAEQAIADRLKLCAAVLRGAESRLSSELAARVREGMAPILEQLKLAAMEKSAPLKQLGALKQAALSCFALMSAVAALAASPEVELPEATRVNVADTLDQMATVVRRGSFPREVSLDLPSEASLSPLARDLLVTVRDSAMRFAESDSPAPAQAPSTKKGGFLVADAFTNPEHVQYALKTTAAAVFCYLLYSLLDWPGIHTCFLTCYLVAQTTAAESVEKLSLRIVGCLIGAAAGTAAIVFLLPALTSIGGLMIAVFIGAYAGAYVAAGGPRISYAGFQITFAFFLCIIQGSGPAFDLTVGRDRTIGIIIGNLVAYFALAHVWPASISARVDSALAAALRQLAKIASTKEPRERRLLTSQVQSTLGEAESAVELAHYEPPSIRNPDAWLAARRQAVEHSQSLSTWLLLSADTRGPAQVGAAMRLESLAMRLTGSSAAQPVAPAAVDSAQESQTLPARVASRLQALEEALVPDAQEIEGISHAHA